MSRSICRVCLRTDIKIKDIDDELVDFHDEITAFSIYENKALKYCTACEYLLKKFYTFSKKCIKANNILKEHKLQKKMHFPNDLHELLPTTLSSCITSTINQFNLVNGYLQPLIKQEPDSVFLEIPEVTTLTVKVPPDNQSYEFSSYDVKMSNDSLFYQNENECKITLSEMTGVDFEDENDPTEDMNLGDSKRIQDLKVKQEQNELKVKQEYRDTDMSDNNLEEDSSDKEIMIEIEEVNDDSSSKTDKTKKKKRFKANPRAKGPLRNRQEYEQVFDIQVFESEQDAINELEGRKTKEPFLSAEHKCDICYTVYKHAKLLAFHKNWHDPSRGDAECEVCRMRFKNKRDVNKHKYGSHYGKFKCKKCPMVTYHKVAMETHYKLHAGGPISCKLCDHTFNHPSTYKSHLRLRHETVHICVSCARTFVSEKGLLAHRKIKHKTQSMTDSDANAHCEPCGVTFKNEQVYIVHVKNSERHSDLAKTITACKVCGVTVEHHSDLKEHTRTHHPTLISNVASRNADQYKCSICGLVGPSRSWVCKHIVEKHPDSSYVADLTKRRKHMCDTCGKCYVTVYSLRDHLNTHTGAKPYACASCPARFTSRVNLKIHGERHAPAKRECKHCGKKYRTASTLSNHIRSHIQDRRYKCTICHKGFYHASTLREHVNGVHNHQRRVRKLVKREAVSHES